MLQDGGEVPHGIPRKGTDTLQGSGALHMEPESEAGSPTVGSPTLGLHQRKGASTAALSDPEGVAQLASSHELLAEYLNAIRLLTAAVHDDRKTKADLIRLSDRVLEAQTVRWTQPRSCFAATAAGH